MLSALFLHSDVQDPYSLYAGLLRDTPLRWDANTDLWAMYSYKHCKELLTSHSVEIPAVNKNGLNEYALLIADHLTRLSNGAQHAIARQTAALLFESMNKMNVSIIADQLLTSNHSVKIDWVNDICKKMPVSVVLHAFGFNRQDSDFIINHIEKLVRIMLPSKIPQQVSAINAISKDFYFIIEKHLLTAAFFKTILNTLTKAYPAKADSFLPLCVSNMAGLFIQTYDASRGLLSNSLLQVLTNYQFNTEMFPDSAVVQQSVIETLRFAPPVHHTRRIAISDIQIDNTVIKKGQSMLIVLAAANRDATKFEDPHVFNISRYNNSEHLSFGTGPHECLAKHFSVHLTTQTLLFFLNRYKNFKLLEKEISYEPLSNARLPKNIFLSFTTK